MMDWLRIIWKPVEKVLKFIGKVQSTILLSIFYFIILAPIAIVFGGAKLLQSKSTQRSYWQKRPDLEETEETLLRQF